MADDWDLYAVVRSYTADYSSSATFPVINDDDDQSSNVEESFTDDLSSLSYQYYDDNPFQFPTLLDNENKSNFQGLEEIFRQLHVESQPNPISDDASAIPFLATSENQQEMQEIIQQEVSQAGTDPCPTINPATNSQSTRSRRRKNQLTKVVHQMTQEELSTDSWAWRKYGQKPIKGSPYPRNYYRCSTLKGCVARKQVERSPADPNIFVVSYTGEHTHPRPIHRSSLAGSTRSKLSAFNKTTSTDPAVSKPSCSSSSSFSPKKEGDGGSTSHDGLQKEDLYGEEDQVVEMVEEEDDDVDQEILIPNIAMSEEIFRGFQELVGTNSPNSSSATIDDNY